jgi:nucleotide-binding universal stress UspA family protein
MKLSQLTESFVISNDEFEDYLNRATEQLVSELSSGKNPRDAVHDLALTFADQHNKSYDAYQRMADSLEARMHTLEMNSPTDMMNGPEDDMGMGSVDDPEMMSDPMGNMEMNTPASSEMPSDSDMEDYSAVMDNKSEVEESINEDSDEEKARQRALAKADEPERGEERKKVSLKKAPWEESVNEDDSEQVKVIFRKFPEGDVIALFPEQDQGRGLIGSYMTIGQHSDASKSLITDLEPASKEEYAKLAAELERIGYDIVMAESVNEEIDGKAIDTIRKIADEKSAMKVKFDDGTMMVDMFTASAVKSVYDNVNDANKEKLDNLMKTKDGMMKVANLSMKMLKEGKLNEFVPFLGMLGRAVGGAVGAVSKAGGVANAVSKAGGVANVAKKAIPTARSIGKIAPAYAVGSELVKGVKNAFKDPTHRSATGRHLESIEEKADNIMKSAIDKVNKK